MNLSAEQILPLFTKEKPADRHTIFAEIDRLIKSSQELDLMLVDQADWRLMLNVRAAGGVTVPEQHRDWHDVSLYLAGSNKISVGGKLAGAEATSGGEQRGGSLEPVSTYALKIGDLLVVPSGAPHQNNFSPGTAFAIIKVRAGREAKSPVGDIVSDWGGITHIASHVSSQ